MPRGLQRPENGYTYDQKLDTKAKDGYKSDQRNIGMHHAEARERVGGFSHSLVPIKNEEWANICDLGASNEQMDPKIRIYMKNRVERCFRQTKMATIIARKCWSKMLHDGQWLVNDSQWRRSKVTVDINDQNKNSTVESLKVNGQTSMDGSKSMVKYTCFWRWMTMIFLQLNSMSGELCNGVGSVLIGDSETLQPRLGGIGSA